ncbi:trypsin-like serine protease [Sphingomonas panni]
MLALALATGFTDDSVAQERGQAAPDDRIVFSPIEDRVGGSVQVVGGQTVDTRNWRTVFLAQIGWVVDRDGKRILDVDGKPIPNTCTATLVGPGVALTAAHCLDRVDGASIRSASLRLTDRDGSALTLDMTCTLPTGYVSAGWKPPSPRNEQDWSLCRFASPNGPPILKGLRYEVVETATVVPEGRQVLISGYGCKDLRIGANGLEGLRYDNVFTIADAKVDDPNSQGRIEIFSDGATRPSICFGDSGGPLMTGVTTATQEAPSPAGSSR